jgi:hypothetical protein
MSNHPEDTTVYVEKTPPEAHQRRPPEGIQGWGADLDPQARPAYPRERTPPRFINKHWDDLEHQQPTVKVFHSNERPGLTPVFGTAQPPSGLSGMIRADRVNVVEGIIDDLSHGHVPNLFTEMGGPAEWRYNRQGFVRKAVIAGGVVALLLYMNGRRRRR